MISPQDQAVAALGEFQSFEKAHPQQYLVRVGVDAGAYVMQGDVAEADRVESGVVGDDPAVGGAGGHRAAPFQAQAAGQGGRDRDPGGAGVEHDFDRLTVDARGGDVVALAIASEYDGGEAVAVDGAGDVLVGIALVVEHAAEEHGRQDQSQQPGGDDHAAADAAGRAHSALL